MDPNPRAKPHYPDGERPFLEHFAEHDRVPQRIELDPLPFQIGRQASSHYVIHSQRVSKNHAQIIWSENEFVIVDQNSTNGTFVNGERINRARLKANDIIHIAHKELRFCLESAPTSSVQAIVGPTVQGTQTLTDSLIRGWQMLKEVIHNDQVQAVFQPIVHLMTEEVIGFEMLSRITNKEMGPNPAAALVLADKLEIAAELSRMFRRVGMEDARQIPGRVHFFFNVHPSEMLDFSFIDSLGEPAAQFRAHGRQLVLEIHEDAITNAQSIRQLRDRLCKNGIALAFDDFGAGQSRLAELADAAPDFIKLDMHLVRGIDKAPARQDLVRAINEFAKRLDVEIIAEGVETRAEAIACQKLGCTFAQGYLFGRPSPAAKFADDVSATCRDTEMITQQMMRLGLTPCTDDEDRARMS
jgi:EAL domain-containing protein (putative c-di-GMP-specific phosphodiesterase class I)